MAEYTAPQTPDVETPQAKTAGDTVIPSAAPSELAPADPAAVTEQPDNSGGTGIEPPAVEPIAPAEPEPQTTDIRGNMVAGIGSWLKGKAPAPTRVLLAEERAAKMANFTAKFINDTVEIGGKTFRMNLVGADEGAVDNLLNGLATEYRSAINDAKRGVITDAKLKQLASDSGFSEADILGMAKGSTLNAEKMLAARTVLGTAARQVLGMKDELKLAGLINDTEARTVLGNQMALLFDLEAKTRGASSELGRALRANQIPITGTPEARRIADFMRQINEPTGQGWKRVMKLLDTIETPEQMQDVSKLMNVRPNAFVEIWINSLLSGPATHAANLVGNMLATTNGVLERLAAGGVGAVRRSLGGSDNGVYMDEGLEMIMAIPSAFAAASRAAKQLFRTGQSEFGGNKFDLITGRAISADNYNLTGTMGAAVDGLGMMINLPTKMLGTSDEWFKAFNFQLGLRARALREARIQGLSGNRMTTEMDRIMKSPEVFSQVFDDAKDYANYVTFHSQLGKLGSGLQEISNANPLTKMLLPFVTTPVNLASYTFERFGPLSLAHGKIRAELAAGGASRDLAMAKIGMSSAAGMTAATYVFNGYLTGRGPLDPNIKAALEAQGWKPYSIWNPITKRYEGYSRSDPLGLWLGTIADATQILSSLPKHDAESLIAGLTVAGSGVFLNKTYMQGFAGLVDALESTSRGRLDGGVQRWTEQYAGSLVPAAVAQWTRANDPVMRDVHGWLDSIYSRTPGYSKEVPPLRDLYGRPRMREGYTGWAPDIAIPIQTGTPVDEPGLKAIVENSISIGNMPRQLVGPSPNEIEVDPDKAAKLPGVKLTPKEYDRWGEILQSLEVGGKTLKDRLDEMAVDYTEKGWLNGPDSKGAIRMKAKVMEYRKRALNILERENDREIQNRIRDYYYEKAKRYRDTTPVGAEEGASVDSGSPVKAGSGVAGGIQKMFSR